MNTDEDKKEDLDWAGAVQHAMEEAGEEDDDTAPVNVVSSGGLSEGAQPQSTELPYVTLLKAAVAMVQTNEISIEEYVEGIKKLDVIADNALKVYAIPAVKKDLPGKLDEHQNAIVSGLEQQIHALKDGLAILLSYPDSRDVGDLLEGQEKSVNALNAIGRIQKAADAEAAAIRERDKEEKAKRAQRAAEAEAEAES